MCMLMGIEPKQYPSRVLKHAAVGGTFNQSVFFSTRPTIVDPDATEGRVLNERCAVMAIIECEAYGTEIESVSSLDCEECGMLCCGDRCERRHVYAGSDEEDDEEDDHSDDDTATADDDDAEDDDDNEDDDFDDDFDDDEVEGDDDDDENNDDGESKEDDDASDEQLTSTSDPPGPWAAVSLNTTTTRPTE